MERWIKEALFCWETSETKLNPPASVTEIERTEKALNFKFPDDFKQFYKVADGFTGLAWQKHLFTLWPLEMMVKKFEDYNNKNFIGFCDFLLASHFIGFNANRTGIFKSYQYEDGVLIADTFEELIKMVNQKNKLIY